MHSSLGRELEVANYLHFHSFAALLRRRRAVSQDFKWSWRCWRSTLTQCVDRNAPGETTHAVI